jgi:hypothetical protein
MSLPDDRGIWIEIYHGSDDSERKRRPWSVCELWWWDHCEDHKAVQEWAVGLAWIHHGNDGRITVAVAAYFRWL